MASLLEEENKDLLMKLFVARCEVENAKARLNEMNQRLQAYENMYVLYYEVKTKLLEAKETISNYESTINHLQKVNSDLMAENSNLKQPQYKSESPLITFHPKPIEKPEKPKQNFKPQPPVAQHVSTAPETKVVPKNSKVSTIAEKLKLSLSQKPLPSPEPVPPASQPKKAEKAQIPRIVVKETPTSTKQNTKTVNKTNSIMVTKLWRGLTKNDILEYFGKFGKIIAVSMTESANEMLDGYKYMFLKFNDAKVVEKLLANNGSHAIKKVNVVVKPGTHTF